MANQQLKWSNGEPISRPSDVKEELRATGQQELRESHDLQSLHEEVALLQKEIMTAAQLLKLCNRRTLQQHIYMGCYKARKQCYVKKLEFSGRI